MLNSPRHQGERQSLFLRSVQGFATCVSALATLFAVPWLYGVTIVVVKTFVIVNYGESWGSLVQVVYHIVLFPTVFFLVRATLATLILMGATWTATRFL